MDQRADLKQLARQVIDLLEAELQASGYQLLDVRLFRGGGRLQVRIYVDTADGITLDGCAVAARTTGMLLEEADIFPGRYVIEVSSPGIRRPLRTLEHFDAAVGQRIDLKVATDRKDRRVAGILQEIRDDVLVIATAESPDQTAVSGAVSGAVSEAGDDPEPGPTTEFRVGLDQVLEGNLDPEFDAQALINADRRRRKEEKREKRSLRAKQRKNARARKKGK